MESLLSGETGDRIEMEMEAFNGTYLVSCNSVYNDQGAVERIIHIATEISDKKIPESALRESQQRFEQFFNGIADAVFVADPETRRLVDCNKKAELLTGYSREKILSMTAPELHPEEVREETMEAFQQHLIKDFIAESLILLQNGTNIPVAINSLRTNINGKDVLLGVFRDISWRKETERAFRDSEEKFKALSDATFEALFFSDKGVCVECNRAATDMFGYSYEELIGIFGTDVIAEESKEVVRSNMMSGYELPYEALAQRKDGTTFWGEFHGKMYEYRGRTIRVTAVRDISARKRAEVELNLYREHLEEIVKARTTELEAFSYSVSHDLKAPLRAIDGFSHILLDEYKDLLDEKGKRYLKIVRENTQQMGNLIQDLLEFSRVGRVHLKPEVFNLHDMIQGIMNELLKQEPSRSISVNLQKIPDVFVDQTLMKQLFANLLSNAFKFTRTRKHARITVGSRETTDAIKFFVKDNGVGFDMKYSKKLFTVFQRLHTQDEYEGTGVGLAIVHRIISRLGGEISAKSNPGKGTTISFSLPKNLVLLASSDKSNENQ